MADKRAPASLLDADMMELANRSPVDWWLVFAEGQGHWWQRLLRPGFGHVYALRWDGWNWICLDPALGFTDIHVLPVASPEISDVVSTECCVILRVEVWRERCRYRVPWVLAPWTCVEQIKGLLGIRATHVITPYQLFKHLSRRAQDGRILRR